MDAPTIRIASANRHALVTRIRTMTKALQVRLAAPVYLASPSVGEIAIAQCVRTNRFIFIRALGATQMLEDNGCHVPSLCDSLWVCSFQSVLAATFL